LNFILHFVGSAFSAPSFPATEQIKTSADIKAATKSLLRRFTHVMFICTSIFRGL
jgi:hypothetical protein